MLEFTNTSWAPWHVISGMDDNLRTIEVFRIVDEMVRNALQLRREQHGGAEGGVERDPAGRLPFVKMPLLKDVDLSKKLDPEKVQKAAEKGAGAPVAPAQHDLPQEGAGHRRVRGLGRGRQGRQHPARGRRARPARVRGGADCVAEPRGEKPSITCGASGAGCRNPGTWRFSTARGTAA